MDLSRGLAAWPVVLLLAVSSEICLGSETSRASESRVAAGAVETAHAVCTTTRPQNQGTPLTQMASDRFGATDSFERGSDADRLTTTAQPDDTRIFPRPDRRRSDAAGIANRTRCFFRIPRTDLRSAFRLFEQQAEIGGRRVYSYLSSDLIPKGFVTPELDGVFGVEDAVAALLRDSGLS